MNQLQGAGGMMNTNMGGGNMNVSSIGMSGSNMGPSNCIPNIGQNIGGNIGMSRGVMQGQHAAHSINTFNTGQCAKLKQCQPPWLNIQMSLHAACCLQKLLIVFGIIIISYDISYFLDTHGYVA